ncbi:MAG TPA: prepilin peptidase [Afifellaceae bacterium]|nr:prepilin peptidase [Afifellaceae bacterium]
MDSAMAVSSAAAWAATVLFPAAMIYAGIADLLTFKIRNALVLAVVLAFLVLAPIAGFGLVEIALSLAVALAVFIVTFGFFAAGWIGGGDAKLATAAALWFGWEHALSYFVLAAVLGGALTLALIAFRQVPLPAALACRDALSRLHAASSGVPYGAALAAAALIVFPETGWYAAAVGR